jgi:hypothetical protein
MPAVMLKLRFSLTSAARSTVTPRRGPTGTLKANAPGGPMCGSPRRLKRIRSIALASVRCPTVERASAPMRSWSTMIAGRQPVEDVDVGPRERRHEALHERAVGLVDQPLGLRGDRAEHQRALARARDPGEDGQPPLRELDADVLEVVHARAEHADALVPSATWPVAHSSSTSGGRRPWSPREPARRRRAGAARCPTRALGHGAPRAGAAQPLQVDAAQQAREAERRRPHGDPGDVVEHVVPAEVDRRGGREREPDPQRDLHPPPIPSR